MHVFSALLSASLLVGTTVLAQEGAPVGPAQPVASYTCDASTCKLPTCFCPTTSPPGGLDPKKIPQFITLTFDDAINTPVLPVIEAMVNGWKPNPNGCPHSSTFFVSNQYTDYWLVQRMYAMGHEIGVHTVNHLGNPPATEIKASFEALNAFAGIPKNKLLGFRHPFLAYNGQSFANLAGLGTFLYDSSMPYDGKASPYWPYTLDNGPVATCQSGTCDGNFKFPGLWEIPMYTLLNPDGTENTSMDPNGLPGGNPIPTKDDVVNLLRRNFEAHFNGNRTPFGIYIHAATQLSQPQRLEAFKEFIQWVQDTHYDEVYWVNNQQLLSWIQQPTDLARSKVSPTLGCYLPAKGPSITEVCDGIDNKGDGNIDAGLVQNCAFPPDAYFSTCFGCPTKIPNVTESIPARTEQRAFIPDAGCPDGGVWDPAGARCVAVSRPATAPTPASNLPTPAGPGTFIPGTAAVIPEGSGGDNGGDKSKGNSASRSVVAGTLTMLGGLIAMASYAM
ncbi:hypothetical protein HDU85_001117 [Gaertneriomyces sp. JEL0708]|nr:hypothetical protein HDU85_001117 [Gaertneriomyces sp. JEL0708]